MLPVARELAPKFLRLIHFSNAPSLQILFGADSLISCSECYAPIQSEAYNDLECVQAL